MKKILLISISILFANQMEVDGNLKVTGQIDASNQRIKNVGPPTDMMDAVNAQALYNLLNDTRNFEVEYYYVTFDDLTSNGGSMNSWYREYGSNSNINGWPNFINNKTANGWKINNTFSSFSDNNNMNILYELVRYYDE